MKLMVVQQIDYVVCAMLGATTLLATTCVTCPFIGRIARAVAWGAWLYLGNTRG